jgi:outer membrane protein OmpA-like peptidoglycan-associated protein
MQHTYGLIAGGSALALAGVLSVQTGLFAQRQDAPPAAQLTVPQPVAAVPAPAPVAAVEASAAALEDRIATLETTLADREAALAGLADTLAARDASLAEVTGALADREAELTALRDELAERELELADLRERFAFDIQLAALKAGEPVAAEAAALDAPAPAPPAAEQPLTTVHFDTGSARLSPGGQVHCAAVAVMLADMKLGSVRLVGFTDRTGSPALNRSLAVARARAVADFLVAQGVPAGLIETAGVTEGALPVPTDPGVPEPLNRSVSIVAVPLSTS